MKWSRYKRLGSGDCIILLMQSIVLIATLTSFQVANASYAISIDPASEECFTFLTPGTTGSTSTISGSFEVLHDDVDSYELSVKIADLKSGDSLYKVPFGTQEG